jgi:hypothetical protein
MDCEKLKPVIFQKEGEPQDDYIERKIKAEEKFRKHRLGLQERENLILKEEVKKWKKLCEETEAKLTNILYKIEELANKKGKFNPQQLNGILRELKENANKGHG